MSDDVFIRDGTLYDWDTIHDLESVIFDDGSISKDMFTNISNNPNHSIKVDELDNRVVGYSIVLIIRLNAKISRIGVDPCFQGIGIGTNLLESIFQEAVEKKLKEINLFCLKNNFPALQLYKNNGFNICGNNWRYLDLLKTLEN